MYKQKLDSYKDSWETPKWLFKILNDRFNFTLDAAASKESSKCSKFYSEGFSDSWKNERVFCNPPFSKKSKFIEKAYNEVVNGTCPLCVMILPNCIETKAFHQHIHGKFYWEPVEKRISFIHPDTKKPISGNTSGTIIVYFWKKIIKPQ